MRKFITKFLALLGTIAIIILIMDRTGFMPWPIFVRAILSPFGLLVNSDFMMAMTMLATPILIPVACIGIYYLIKAIICTIIALIDKIREPKIKVDDLTQKQDLLRTLSREDTRRPS